MVEIHKEYFLEELWGRNGLRRENEKKKKISDSVSPGNHFA